MADLKLTQASGLALTIPARTIRTRQSLPGGKLADSPSAASVIRYRIGGELRTRILNDTFDELSKMLSDDKSARKDWFEVETHEGERYAFFPSDVAAVEDLDPEAPASQGCSALIDLKIDDEENFVVTGLYAKADPAEVREAKEPPQAADRLAACSAPLKGGRRRRPK